MSFSILTIIKTAMTGMKVAISGLTIGQFANLLLQKCSLHNNRDKEIFNNDEVADDRKTSKNTPLKNFISKTKNKVNSFFDILAAPSTLKIIAVLSVAATIAVSGLSIPIAAIFVATIGSLALSTTIEAIRFRNLKNRELENEILHHIYDNQDQKEIVALIKRIEAKKDTKSAMQKKFDSSWSALKAVTNSPQSIVSIIGPIVTFEPITIGINTTLAVISYLVNIPLRIQFDKAMVDLRNDTAKLKNDLGMPNIKIKELLQECSGINDFKELKRAKFMDSLYETAIKTGFSASKRYKSFTPKNIIDSSSKMGANNPLFDKEIDNIKSIESLTISRSDPQIAEPRHSLGTAIKNSDLVKSNQDLLLDNSKKFIPKSFTKNIVMSNPSSIDQTKRQKH